MSVLRTHCHTPRQCDAGFTLVETLVSLVIFTLALVALLDVFGIGFRGIRSIGLDGAALQLASTQLAQAGTVTPLKAGQQQGTTPDGLGWTVVIEPYVRPGKDPDIVDDTPRRGEPDAYWVTAEIRWKASLFAAEQTLSLRTLKLGGPQ
jgi:prepilin-type N-terminal cleavage/methylation domain-containing protein